MSRRTNDVLPAVTALVTTVMNAPAGASVDVILGMQIGALMQDVELVVARKTLGITQAELAARLGIHEITVSRWERGVIAIPPFLHLALWAIEHNAPR